MSVSFSCHCEERAKPVRKRHWRVVHREHHFSAFNGYHFTPSQYSLVSCHRCGALGRTKAGFVAQLKDGDIFRTGTIG